MPSAVFTLMPGKSLAQLDGIHSGVLRKKYRTPIGINEGNIKDIVARMEESTYKYFRSRGWCRRNTRDTRRRRMSVLRKLSSLFRQNAKGEDAAPISFPYPLSSYSGKEAIRVVLDQDEEGCRLVLLGDLSDGILLTGIAEVEQTPRQIIDASGGISGKGFLKQRHEADPQSFEGVEAGGWPQDVGKEVGGPQIVAPQIVAHTDVSTVRPRKKVYVARVPTPSAHEIPAYLKLGGWNECSDPEELVRYWEEEYSARIVSATGDIVECVVENPPQSREEAMALAREQYVFCPDIVLQGVGTLSNLAAILLKGKTRYFWWD